MGGDDINAYKQKKFITLFAYAAAVTITVYLVAKYLVALLFPFVIGYCVASLLESIVRFCTEKTPFPRRIVSVVIVLTFYATVGTLAVNICIKLFFALGSLFDGLPKFYVETLSPAIASFFDSIKELLKKLDDPSVGSLGDVLNSANITIGSAVSAISAKSISAISSFATDLPTFAVKTVLCVVSTFFFSADLTYINRLILSLIPEKSRENALGFKKCTRNVLFKYCRSYFIIFLITFGELFLGLTVIGVKSSALKALMIALFDILPVVGIGYVLIPWAVIALIMSEKRLGIMLFILYAFMTVVRNIIEPKIVGREVGLHPTITLMAMYVGTKLFGLIGLIGLPIGLSIAKAVRDCGKQNTK